MSSNNQHNISIHNYEEWFVLYMDNELSAPEKKMVDDFLLRHPHLQEELEILLSTKLPAEEMVFAGKEELLAPSMKLNSVDEALLLYIDNELPAAEQKKVENKLASDTDFRLQYELLQNVKVDSAEVIPYPDKTELYRRTERRVLLPVWMRIAAAVAVLLAGGYFFTPDRPANEIVSNEVPVVEQPTGAPKRAVPVAPADEKLVPQQQDLLARATSNNKQETKMPVAKAERSMNENKPDATVSVTPPTETIALRQQASVRVSLEKLTVQPFSSAVNNSVANLAVTSAQPVALNITEDPEGPAVTDGDDKQNHRTPAKGFLRKVSRFIERRTGIGTVNADNELLVGAVALKLN